MDEDSGKSGKYPLVTEGDQTILRLLVSAIILVSLGTFVTGAVALGAGSMKGVAGATISLLGGAMAFAAGIHLSLRRKA